MNKKLASLLLVVTVLAASRASADILLAPLAGFGGSDGWLAPGEGGYAYLGTGNNERGLAYGNGHLYLVSRANVSGNSNNIRILDSATGSDLGGLSSSGITGGTFTINTAAVGGDGVVYVNNLANPTSGTAFFKVYAWANEAAAPVVAYTGDGALLGARVGDSFAAFGSGASTQLAAGYGSAPAIAGANGYAIIDPTLGTATRVAFPAAPPNAGDFRLGLTFVDSTHVVGTAGSSLYRYTSFSGTTGTLLGSPAIPDPAGATADRLLAYTTFAGRNLLAVQSTGDSHVSIYDVSNPAVPVWIASRNNTSGSLTANANATGQLAWGGVGSNPDGSPFITLYAMSSNQGIQAITVTSTVPEASAFLAVGLIALVAGGAKWFRRQRSA